MKQVFSTLLLCTLLLLSCGRDLLPPGHDSGTDGDGDSDADVSHDADMGRDANDADLDADPDVDLPDPVPGAWAAIVTDVEVTAERICDVDGVPPDDNSFLTLGAEMGGEVAASLTRLVNEFISRADERFMLSIPWCEDVSSLRCSSAELSMFAAFDDDGNPADNLSGSEPFRASPMWLTTCGEPIYAAQGSASGGFLSVASSRLQLPFLNIPLPLDAARLYGDIASGNVASTLTLCGYINVNDLAMVMDIDGSGRNFLEIIVFPEQVLSNPGITGVQPDIDIDGDGLEELRVDRTTGMLASCIDGDGSVFDGRDCWQRSEIVDSISITVQLNLFPAVYAGCQAGWELAAETPCGSGTTATAICETDGGVDAGPDGGADAGPDAD